MSISTKKSGISLCIYLFILVCNCFFWVSPLHKESMFLSYMWPLTVCLTIIGLQTLLKEKNMASILVASILIWIYFTTIINGDYYLKYNLFFIMGIMYAFGASYFILLLAAPELRTKYFNIITVIYIACISMLAAGGVYATIMHTQIVLPFTELGLGIREYRLYAFWQHPNLFGSALLIAVLLSLYMVFKTKKTYIKVIFIILSIIQSLALILTMSRTTLVLLALTYAWAVGLCVVNMLKNKSKVLSLSVALATGILTAISILLISTPLAILLSNSNSEINTTHSISIINKAIADTNEKTTITAEENNIPKKSEIKARTNEDLANLSFSNRDKIWGVALNYLKENPKALLFGTLNNVAGHLAIKAGVTDAYHLHSAFIAILLIGGVPGLVLYLLFLATMLRACIRILIHKKSTTAYRMLIIAVPLAMINATMELYPSISGEIMDMMFLLICSFIIYIQSTLYPKKDVKNLA